MTASSYSCCGNCKHRAGNYPIQRVMESSGDELPVAKDSDWGWCAKKASGMTLGYPKHKQVVPNVGVETHYEFACSDHEGNQGAD